MPEASQQGKKWQPPSLSQALGQAANARHPTRQSLHYSTHKFMAASHKFMDMLEASMDMKSVTDRAAQTLCQLRSSKAWT